MTPKIGEMQTLNDSKATEKSISYITTSLKGEDWSEDRTSKKSKTGAIDNSEVKVK